MELKLVFSEDWERRYSVKRLTWLRANEMVPVIPTWRAMLA
jgi:hypothetical protein